MALIYRRLERGLRKVDPKLRKEAQVLMGFVQAHWDSLPRSYIRWERSPVEKMHEYEFGKTLIPLPVFKNGKPEYNPNYLGLSFDSLDVGLTISLSKTNEGISRSVYLKRGESEVLEHFEDIYSLLKYISSRFIPTG